MQLKAFKTLIFPSSSNIFREKILFEKRKHPCFSFSLDFFCTWHTGGSERMKKAFTQGTTAKKAYSLRSSTRERWKNWAMKGILLISFPVCTISIKNQLQAAPHEVCMPNATKVIVPKLRWVCVHWATTWITIQFPSIVVLKDMKPFSLSNWKTDDGEGRCRKRKSFFGEFSNKTVDTVNGER